MARSNEEILSELNRVRVGLEINWEVIIFWAAFSTASLLLVVVRFSGGSMASILGVLGAAMALAVLVFLKRRDVDRWIRKRSRKDLGEIVHSESRKMEILAGAIASVCEREVASEILKEIDRRGGLPGWKYNRYVKRAQQAIRDRKENRTKRTLKTIAESRYCEDRDGNLIVEQVSTNGDNIAILR